MTRAPALVWLGHQVIHINRLAYTRIHQITTWNLPRRNPTVLSMNVCIGNEWLRKCHQWPDSTRRSSCVVCVTTQFASTNKLVRCLEEKSVTLSIILRLASYGKFDDSMCKRADNDLGPIATFFTKGEKLVISTVPKHKAISSCHSFYI